MNKKYFLSTGESDYERLSLLSKLYNPLALSFLMDSGLKPGMTVLEVGCGSGHMACDLARLVGSKGKVIAIDSSESQIEMAKKTAEDLGVDNIDFYVCDVFDLDKLGLSYDATYGRWVIEFSQQPAKALQNMYQHLKAGGILCYEAMSVRPGSYFIYPQTSLVEDWFTVARKIFSVHGYNVLLGNEVPHQLRALNCKEIKAKTNQAILLTAEEKSLYRLGLYAVKESILNNKILSAQEIDAFCDKLVDFENSDAISGFYSNIIVSGIK
jgi:ubiquinone/menaquinone biosynthesis C-methylase UbiE